MLENEGIARGMLTKGYEFNEVVKFWVRSNQIQICVFEPYNRGTPRRLLSLKFQCVTTLHLPRHVRWT